MTNCTCHKPLVGRRLDIDLPHHAIHCMRCGGEVVYKLGREIQDFVENGPPKEPKRGGRNKSSRSKKQRVRADEDAYPIYPRKGH